MTYIFLVAGMGSRLRPLTLRRPKALYMLEDQTTIFQRMIDLIKSVDKEAEIIAVTGFMSQQIEDEIAGIQFVQNPFYAVTNSIASLWFVKEYLGKDNVTIINGDVVVSEELVKDIICVPATRPYVLLDSSIKTEGDYNVQITHDGKVLVMSKDLREYYGEYAGVTKLDRDSALLLKKEIDYMVKEGIYQQWYEDALVQMIFSQNFNLYFQDISNYEWVEVDSVNDMVYAKRICKNYKNSQSSS